jgi:hypothetical protein
VRADLPKGTPVVDAALGPTWWRDTFSVAGHTPSARRQLWNAVAVEALSLRLSGWEGAAVPPGVAAPAATGGQGESHLP